MGFLHVLQWRCFFVVASLVLELVAIISVWYFALQLITKVIHIFHTVTVVDIVLSGVKGQGGTFACNSG